MESEFQAWAASQQLTEETISVLLENGVNSRDSLSALTPEDLLTLCLKLGQMALVRRLISAESASASTDSSPSTALSIVRRLQVSCILHVQIYILSVWSNYLC